MGVTTLPFDFDIFLRSGSRIQPDSAALAPRDRVVLEVARTMVENSQVRMMSWRLRPHVHGERAGEQVVVVIPAAGDLRGERRRGPRVHDVGVADEAAGLVALRLVEARRAVRSGGRPAASSSVGDERVVVVGLALGVEAVPDAGSGRRSSAGG